MSRWRWISLYLGSALILFALCVGPYYAATQARSATNHVGAIKLLTQQNNSLASQLKSSQAAQTNDKYELNEAIAAIQKLAIQVEKLGGSPGNIEIKPMPGYTGN